MTIGERLKQARLAAGLSQRQLCGDTITRNMLSQIENGVARPSMDTLQTLARRLNKPVSFFLEEADDPNQTARECFRKGDYEGVRKALEGVQTGENEQDEYYLLKALTCLELAERAVAEGRQPYAVSLLEDAERANRQTPYFVPTLEYRRLLLLAKAKPEEAERILAAIPPDDSQLFLRAKVALSRAEGARAAAILDAAQDQTSKQWHLLRGRAAFAQGEYRTAAECFHRVEEAGDPCVYSWLERCYQQLEDYKMAYYYACKQK